MYVGGTGVDTSTGFLLTPGDDVFIEINNMTEIFVIAETTNVIVYAIGS